MGEHCDHCDEKADAIRGQTRVLWTVLFINLVMFFVEIISGFLSHSLSLIGDSLDMMGDVFAYAGSIYAVDKSQVFKAKASILKGSIMLLFGGIVFGRALYQVMAGTMPDGSSMTIIGSLAFVANLTCLALLTRYRNGDINMRSVWICSRNDIISNILIIIAAFLVQIWQSPWPDIWVGIMITALFVYSGFFILKEAFAELRSIQKS
jgi:cation diffusion facilitator family transporter